MTIEGSRHALEAPFLVLATQNPRDFKARSRSPNHSSIVPVSALAGLSRCRAPAVLRLGLQPPRHTELFRAAQAEALVAGREFDLTDDVQRVSGTVLQDRVVGPGVEARRAKCLCQAGIAWRERQVAAPFSTRPTSTLI